MAIPEEIRPVLAQYPPACQPRSVEPLGGAGGFSGARFWRLTAATGTLCLRRWPPEHPDRQRLEFIQAVLWHVCQEGFRLVPLPLETRSFAGYVSHQGYLWELSPWMAGQADYRQQPSRQKLAAAMIALARFHQAAESFPLPDPGPRPSPAVADRQAQLSRLLSGQLARITSRIPTGGWPELAPRAQRLLELFPRIAPFVARQLDKMSSLPVRMQPAIRDIWHDHVLFSGEEVTGLIDFGAMKPENPAADLARLLGSLARDDAEAWAAGLEAYDQVRPLDADQRRLVVVLDESGVLLSGISWLQWIYIEEREFEHRAKIIDRLDETLVRLEHLGKKSS